MEEKKYLEALDMVISKRYSSREYSFNGYKEEAVCLQKEKNKWIVFIGERGNRYGEVKCRTILLACLEFIHKVASKAETLTEMENEFLNIITKVA